MGPQWFQVVHPKGRPVPGPPAGRGPLQGPGPNLFRQATQDCAGMMASQTTFIAVITFSGLAYRRDLSNGTREEPWPTGLRRRTAHMTEEQNDQTTEGPVSGAESETAPTPVPETTNQAAIPMPAASPPPPEQSI